MADGFQEGYEKGRADAQANQNRDLRPPFGKAVVRGDAYVDTYMEGYKEGYRAAKEREH